MLDMNNTTKAHEVGESMFDSNFVIRDITFNDFDNLRTVKVSGPLFDDEFESTWRAYVTARSAIPRLAGCVTGTVVGRHKSANSIMWTFEFHGISDWDRKMIAIKK